MKYIISIAIVSLLFSCSSPKEHKLDYILGQWKRTNNQKNKTTFEYWRKSKGNIYIGLGYTLQEGDTVFKEKLRILKIDGVWNYEVTGVNPEPTYFKFTHQTDNSFVCENPENEFPKKIQYVYSNNSLRALISNHSNKIEFIFIKN